MLAEHRKELNLRKRLPYGTAPMRSVINAYKFGSRKRNIEYALTEEQFKDITTKNCHYCGVTPFHRESGLWDHYQYNGIDRVDNNKGYTLDNCVPCCRPCNWAKMDSTLDEFKLRTKKLYEGFKVRGEL
jgi:hypothetical protein